MQLVDQLLKLGYSPNAPLRASGWTPLMIAAAEGHEKAVSLLLEAGAEPNAQNDLGRTALMFASNYGFAPIVGALLAKGANPNIVPRDKDGWTALMVAAKTGHTQTVRALLDHGADKSLKDKADRTALDLAEVGGHSEVVLLLK